MLFEETGDMGSDLASEISELRKIVEDMKIVKWETRLFSVTTVANMRALHANADPARDIYESTRSTDLSPSQVPDLCDMNTRIVDHNLYHIHVLIITANKDLAHGDSKHLSILLAVQTSPTAHQIPESHLLTPYIQP